MKQNCFKRILIYSKQSHEYKLSVICKILQLISVIIYFFVWEYNSSNIKYVTNGNIWFWPLDTTHQIQTLCHVCMWYTMYFSIRRQLGLREHLMTSSLINAKPGRRIHHNNVWYVWVILQGTGSWTITLHPQ